MKKLFLLLLSVATLLFYFSCQQLPTESEKPVNTVSVLNLEADGIYYDLIAGQNITVGNVFVWNDGTDLHVEYNITDLDWCLTETHMHVATTLDGIPQTKKGNPIPGQFDYKNEDLINCATYDSYTIPLFDIDPNWICDQELFIAAHAVVLEPQEETAWGGEEPFPGKNWATYFYYEVTCETPPPPPPGDCAECDGKVTQLTLQYDGGSPADVVVKQKNGDVVFDSFLLPGDVFPIVGTDNGTFGEEIKIYVDGNENAKIHTSCSQPIGPGLVEGDFEVISGSSKDGGELCPVPPPPPPGFCDGKVKALLVEYTGQDCSFTNHNQDPSKVECSGDPVFTTPVRILAQDKETPNDPNAKIWFDGQVAVSSTFWIDATNAGETKLMAETHVFIYDLQDNLLQTIEFHTSCSQPLGAGDQFGSLLMFDFIAE